MALQLAESSGNAHLHADWHRGAVILATCGRLPCGSAGQPRRPPQHTGHRTKLRVGRQSLQEIRGAHLQVVRFESGQAHRMPCFHTPTRWSGPSHRKRARKRNMTFDAWSSSCPWLAPRWVARTHAIAVGAESGPEHRRHSCRRRKASDPQDWRDVRLRCYQRLLQSAAAPACLEYLSLPIQMRTHTKHSGRSPQSKTVS